MALQDTPVGSYVRKELEWRPDFRRDIVISEGASAGQLLPSFDSKGSALSPYASLTPYTSSLPPSLASQNALQRGRVVGPVKLFAKLIDFWDLSLVDAIPLLGLDDGDIASVRSILSGASTLRGRDVKERLGLLFEIRAGLGALFNDRDAENRWLREKSPSLRESPLELLRQGSFRDLLAIHQSVSRMTGI